jgi:hypothetical protein
LIFKSNFSIFPRVCVEQSTEILNPLHLYEIINLDFLNEYSNTSLKESLSDIFNKALK